MPLKKICSGGQTGADVAALIAAKMYNIPTGGWMPKGFITQNGPRPEYAGLYGMKEHDSPKYPGRTFLNAKDSDGTIRMATNFNSSGEILTLKAIHQYKKPFLDLDMTDEAKLRPHSEVIDWLLRHNISVLNVAGNSERTSDGITGDCVDYLCRLFEKMGLICQK